MTPKFRTLISVATPKKIVCLAFTAFVCANVVLHSTTSVAARRKRVVIAATPAAPIAGMADKGLAQSELAVRLRARLEKLAANSPLKPGEYGMWVGRSTDLGLETFFAHNSDQQFIPASLSKLITLATVLHELPPGYKFKTQLLAEGEFKEGKLNGPLYLKGGGDPSFVSEDMWLLVNDLTHSGVKEIGGDIVVDDSRFDTVRFGPDRQKERVDRAYDAPVGAMSMNWNAINVYVRPGDHVGDKLKISIDVTTPYLNIKNETKTLSAGHGQTISVERETGPTGSETITIRGSMGTGVPELVVYKSITAPDLYSGFNLIEFLKQRGITVKGSVRKGVAPESAKVLANFDGKPLSGVVGDMAKFSNNFVAEMLVKNLAAEGGEKPGTMEGGLVHARKYLESIGFAKDSYEFVNAAGFTRVNRFTPAQLGRLLETVHNDFTVFPEFVAALPIAGVDGTLHGRMKNTSAERWVRAKTGLLNGVVGLAGYAGRGRSGELAFAFIYNGGGKEDKARAAFDRFAAALVEE